MITQSELKKVLNYDPDTGLFTRISSTTNKCLIGKVAGCINKSGYISILIKSKRYYAHRLAWLYVYGEFPKLNLDHIDTNKNNNSISNLRLCTMSENLKNTKKYSNNKSGYKGVYKHTQTGRYCVQAMILGKKISLGCYASPELASEAYKLFSKINHGEFFNDAP